MYRLVWLVHLICGLHTLCLKTYAQGIYLSYTYVLEVQKLVCYPCLFLLAFFWF